MSLRACKLEAIGMVALDPAARRSGNEAAGFFFSAILHGLGLFFLLFIVTPVGSGGSGTGLLSVPIEVDVAFEKSAQAGLFLIELARLVPRRPSSEPAHVMEWRLQGEAALYG